MKLTRAKWLPNDGLFPGGPANATESAQLASTSRSRLRFQRPHTQQSTAIAVCKSFFFPLAFFFFFKFRIHRDLWLMAAIMAPDPDVKPRRKGLFLSASQSLPRLENSSELFPAGVLGLVKAFSAGIDDSWGTTCTLDDYEEIYLANTLKRNTKPSLSLFNRGYLDVLVFRSEYSISLENGGAESKCKNDWD